MYGPGTEKKEAQSFSVCMKDFLDLYNISEAYQTVDNPLGGDLFRDRPSGSGLKR